MRSSWRRRAPWRSSLSPPRPPAALHDAWLPTGAVFLPSGGFSLSCIQPLGFERSQFCGRLELELLVVVTYRNLRPPARFWGQFSNLLITAGSRMQQCRAERGLPGCLMRHLAAPLDGWRPSVLSERILRVELWLQGAKNAQQYQLQTHGSRACRCHDSMPRVMVSLKIQEGQTGTISAYVISRGTSKTSSAVSYPVRTLCLHHRIRELDGARALGTLEISGDFRSVDMHAWLLAILPDTPQQRQEGGVRLVYESAALQSQLVVVYSDGTAQFQSDSPCTLALLRAALTSCDFSLN